MSSLGTTATNAMPAQPRLSKSSQHKQSNLTLPTGNSNMLHLHSPSPSSPSNAPYITAQQYFQRVTDLQQMDLQSAIDQMRTLISLYPQRVYKMAYYRKQTKNHWARDDPAFSFLQVSMIIASSIMYGFAFRLSSISAIIGFVLKSVLINWLGFGVIVASLGRLIANQHLMTVERSSSHVKQNVEWLYAFDVHCNAFVPLFVILYGVQFFLLPIVLGTSLLSLGVSNTLYAIAFGWYCYITHLGYRGEKFYLHWSCMFFGYQLEMNSNFWNRPQALPFLSNTEVFLFPIAGILVLYVFNFVGYPFGLGWNASRIVAYVFFES